MKTMHLIKEFRYPPIDQMTSNVRTRQTDSNEIAHAKEVYASQKRGSNKLQTAFDEHCEKYSETCFHSGNIFCFHKKGF